MKPIRLKRHHPKCHQLNRGGNTGFCTCRKTFVFIDENKRVPKAVWEAIGSISKKRKRRKAKR